MSATARGDDKCDQNVSEAPWYIHQHRCGNTAKFKARATEAGVEFHFCGTHVKRYQRNENWTVAKISESFA